MLKGIKQPEAENENEMILVLRKDIFDVFQPWISDAPERDSKSLTFNEVLERCKPHRQMFKWSFWFENNLNVVFLTR